MVDGGDAEAPGDGRGLDDDQRVAAESRVRTAFLGSLWSGCRAWTEVLWATVTFGRRWRRRFSADYMISEASTWAPEKGEKDRTEEGVRDYLNPSETSGRGRRRADLRRGISRSGVLIWLGEKGKTERRERGISRRKRGKLLLPKSMGFIPGGEDARSDHGEE
jgi:hypothetical protein